MSARATSSGLVGRESGVDPACLSKCSWDWRGLGKAGPGPMAFTRMRGASAKARLCVSAQSPALETV